MPLEGARYRVMTTKTGQKIRLAFRGKKKIVEAKNLGTGAIHTEDEFAADLKRRVKKRGYGRKTRG